MSPTVLLLVFCLSLAINGACVKIANQQALGIEMSYFKSTLLLLLRTVLCGISGFIVGLIIIMVRGDLKSPSSGLGAAEVLAGIAFAAVSLIIYQQIVRLSTGQRVPITRVLKSAFVEYGLLLAITAVTAVIVGTLIWLIH